MDKIETQVVKDSQDVETQVDNIDFDILSASNTGLGVSEINDFENSYDIETEVGFPRFEEQWYTHFEAK